MKSAIAASRGAAREDAATERLWAAVRPDFLDMLSWDPGVRVVFLPRSHRQFSGSVVPGCEKMAYWAFQQGLCGGCLIRWKKTHLTVEQFSATKRTGRRVGVSACQVPRCQRPGGRNPFLCSSHLHQSKVLGLPLERFLAHPDALPLPAWDPCLVAACDRQGDTQSGYCRTHADQRSSLRRKGRLGDEGLWRATTQAIAESSKISLRGLPDRVAAEFLYGLQERVAEGLLHKDYLLRKVSNAALTQQGPVTHGARPRRSVPARRQPGAGLPQAPPAP